MYTYHACTIQTVARLKYAKCEPKKQMTIVMWLDLASNSACKACVQLFDSSQQTAVSIHEGAHVQVYLCNTNQYEYQLHTVHM